jgi:predicted GNAT family acetyltransferase
MDIPMTTAADLRDNTDKHRYELEIDGHVAYVVYRRHDDAITLVHTEVPKELGGRGVGSTLVRKVLETVRAAGLKVVPTCPFVDAWMRKHPEFDDLLATPRPA